MALRTEAPLLAPSHSEAEREILLSRSQSHDTSKKDQTNSPPPSNLPPQLQLPTNELKEDRVQIQSTSYESRNHRREAKSWQAPVIMLLSLLSAIILATLHDAMNRRLHGNIVNPDGPWNQKWTSRYGTALAFLIKMLLVICVGTAFVQKQWLDLSTHQQTLRIRDLNVLSNALSTPFSLISSLIWLRNPLLLMTAMISWILPFAAIIPPGTLLIESLPHINSTTRTALQFSLNDELKNCSSTLYYEPSNGTSQPLYNFSSLSVSQRLHDLAYTSMVTSQIIPMELDVANETFVANFVGPALNCTVDTDLSIEPATVISIDSILKFEYIAWIGGPGGDLNAEDLDYQIHQYLNDAVSTYNPEILDPQRDNQLERSNILWYITANRSLSTSHVIQCQLWNVTHDVEFVYQNSEQNIIRHNLTYWNPISTILTSSNDHYTEAISLNCFPKTVLAMMGSEIGNIDIWSSLPDQPLADPRFTVNDPSLTPEQLCEAIEETFWNITLSLFSVPEFLTNMTDNISENITNWSNTYVYEQRDLLLAYGLSSLASLICCVLGIYSFFRNGSSFQNNFSTYIRAAEGSSLNLRDFVPAGDTGADPLPKRLGEKTITMASRQR